MSTMEKRCQQRLIRKVNELEELLRDLDRELSPLGMEIVVWDAVEARIDRIGYAWRLMNDLFENFRKEFSSDNGVSL